MAGGQQINVGQGTLTATGDDVTESATGEEATASAGDLTRGNSVRLRSRKVGGGTATHAMTGQAIPVSIGAVTPTPTKTPASIAALLSAGSFGKTRDVPLTGSASTSAAGSVSAGSSGTGVVWQFGDATSLNTGANTTTALATGIPTGATYSISPDPLPGQTLQLSGSTLNLVGDATVPTTSGASAGSLEDAISDRDVVIEVLESPMATIVNVTRGITYEYGTNYTGRTDNQAANRWNAVMWECQPGNIIEISPGAIHATSADMSNYWHTTLTSSMLAVIRPCTIRNMTGRGRWSLLVDDAQLTGDRSGIVIYSPSENWTASRGDFVIEGFAFDNWGRYGDAVRIKNDTEVSGSYAHLHSSVTLRNFKIGRRAGTRSYSGVNGAAETLLLEDGHVYDCGGNTQVGTIGQNHNLYVSARTLTLRGIRNQRTRGWGVPPSGANWNDNNKLVEGHLAKLSAVTGSVEGCVFDCGSMATTTDVSDTSLLMQLKAGGNWSVRGCLFIDTQAPNVANGAINMCREYQTNGVVPNFEWWAGSQGNSLLFERNVYVGHYPRPMIWFFTPAQSAIQALYASGDTSVAPERRLSSLTVRDNIAIMASTAQYGSQWVLSGFPGANNSMWINNDPNGGGTWSGRGNTTRTYSTAAYAFDKRQLLAYTDAAGAPTASQSSASVPQFLWPHGYRNVTRSTQGLG